MALPALVSVEEYLHSSDEPHVDYLELAHRIELASGEIALQLDTPFRIA